MSKEVKQIEIDVIGNISQFSQSIEQIRKQLGKLSLNPKTTDSFRNLFIDLHNEIEEITKLTEHGFVSEQDEKRLQKSLAALTSTYTALFKKIESSGVGSSILSKDKKAIEELKKAQTQYKKSVDETTKARKKAQEVIEADTRKKAALEAKLATAEAKKKETDSDYDAAKKARGAAQRALTKAEKAKDKRLQEDYDNNESKKGFHNTSEYQDYKKALEALEKAQSTFDSISTKKTTTDSKIQQYSTDIQKYVSNIEEAKKTLESLDGVSDKDLFDKSIKSLKEMKDFDWSSIGIDLNKITNAEELSKALEKLAVKADDRAGQAFEHLDEDTEQAAQSLGHIKKQVQEVGDGFDELGRKEKDIAQLKEQLFSFFSIGNAIQLFKRAVNSAFETVKELDATMTEAAVVTDFSIGDMWEKLPQYANEANKLGVSINGLYGATTLYYQQGLKTTEAMGVGIETMKMARIANMQSEEATKAMTAALRGFNMEVNELNAQKVNDVYSELAAITAADTSQIAEAMSKTASIASSANMEFETTSALLAQIIETTQEAPQTAGTALKTIIARFTEIKSLFTKGQLSGADSEGEVIEINKIDTALRTVGISLTDFLNGTKGIDDIFLELASKWDTLDLATQRYIATTAAGSRQQSRFLAMMSDYDRTMELVNAANNSAGASQEQFNKTLESLESKLTRLKNAWDTFAMSLANNDILKLGVDTLTNFLNIVNKLIDGLSGGNGLIKSILSLSAALAGLKLGGSILTHLLEKGGIKTKKATGASLGAEVAEMIKGNIKNAFEKGSAKDLGSDILESIFIGMGTSDSKVVNKAGVVFQKIFGAIAKSPGLAAGITGAVVGAIVLGVHLAKKSYENSLAGQLEQAKRATKEAKEVADEAKEAYDKLLSEHSKYNETQKALEGLTKGTNEWKEALAAANQQVMQLAALYPELRKAGVITIGSEGQFSISDDAWSDLLDKQQRGMKNTQAAFAQSQIVELSLTRDKAWSDLIRTSGAKESGIDELYNLYRNNNLKIESKKDVNNFPINDKDNEVMQLFHDNVVVTSNRLNQLAQDFAEYDKQAAEASKQIEVLTNTMLTSKASEGTLNYRYGQAIIAGAAKHDNTDAVNKRTDELYSKDGQAEAQYNQEFKALADKYGVTSQMVNNDLQDLQTLYSAMTGLAKDEIPEEIAKDKKRLAQEIAKIDVTDTLIEGIEEFRKKMAALDEGQQKALAGLLSGDGSEVTSKELEQLNSIGEYAKQMGYGEGSTGIQAMGQDLGYTDKKLSNLSVQEQRDYALKIEKVDANEIDKWISNNQNRVISVEAQLQLDSERAKEQMQKIHANAMTIFGTKVIDPKLFENLDIETEKGLSTQIDSMGKKDAQKYMESWNEVINSEGLGKEQKKNLETYLSQVDWSSMTEAVNAMEYMQTMGVDTSAIANYWSAATKGCNTYIKSVAEAVQLTDSLHNNSNQISEIEERLISGNATADDITKLEAAGVDLEGKLIRTADGWQMLEGDAANAIEYLKINGINEVNAVLAQFEETMQRAHQAATGELNEFTQLDSETGQYIGTRVDENHKGEIEKGLRAAGFLGEQGTKTDEEYWAAAQEAFQNYINALNSEGSTRELLIQEADYTRATTLTADENRFSGGSEQSIVTSAQNEGIEAGAEREDLVAFQQQLMTTRDLSASVAAELATYNTKMNLGLSEVISSYSDWTSLIDESTGTIKASTSEDIAAFNDLKQSVNKMLNTSVDLSDAFWDSAENMELLKQAAEGDTDALGELQKKAAEDYLVNLEVQDEDAQAAIADLIDLIENTELPALDTGDVLDNQGFIDSCNKLIEQADLTREQVSSAFKSMGYDVDFNDNMQQVTQTMAVPTTTYTMQRDANGQVTSITPSVTVEQIDYPSYVAAPTIKTLTSAGSGGGGVSTSNKSRGASNKPKRSGGGGGGKKGKEEKKEVWKNPYDEFYNLTEKVNEALRQRERLEREYDRLLKNRKATSKDLMNNSLAQIASLRKEIDYQKQLQSARERQISDLGSQKHADKDGNLKSFSSWGVTQYGSYDVNTGTISIDWDAINKVTDEEKGGAIEAYISKLEELSGQFEETQDTIEQMEDQIQEIKEQNKDGYLELEQRIYDALVAREQEVINEYQKLSDTINNSNSEILNSLRESIELERQIEQNTKTEEDINEKEARLAYLKRDTSGAFDTEILQLEKELEDARENYGNTLIDQEISRLDKENQKAEEQRNKQIEIMQAQLDYAAKSGDFWAETYSLIASAVGPDGHLANNSPLVELLQATEAFKGMSEIGQFNWIGELVQEFNAAKQGEANWRLDMAEQAGSATLSNGTRVTYDSSTDTWVDSAGYIYKDLKYNSDTGYFDYGSWVAPTPPSTTGSSSASAETSFPYGKASETTGNLKYSRKNGGNSVRAIQYALNQLGYGNSGTAKMDGYFGSGTRTAVKAFQAANGISADGIVGKNTREKFKIHGYKTGGLADYTGPAWLDGTKTHPELVLNAKDTENFIALKDILSKALTGNSSTSQSSGDNYYEIHINVDEIGSDYDVDQLASRIKEKINEDASYRNVNAINFLR